MYDSRLVEYYKQKYLKLFYKKEGKLSWSL